jgi:predicted ATPase
MTKIKRDLSAIVDEIHVELKRDTAGIIKIGTLLAEAKKQVEHGKWLPWIEENFSMSEATAQRYLKVHRFLKTRSVRDLEAAKNLSATALYDLAASAPARPYTPKAIDVIFNEAAEGKRIGYDRVLRIACDFQWEEDKAAARAADEAEALAKRSEAEAKAEAENIISLADAKANEWINTTAEQEAAARANDSEQEAADASAEARKALYADDTDPADPQPKPEQRVVTKADLMDIVDCVVSLGDGSDLTIPDADLELWDALHDAAKTLNKLTSSMFDNDTALSEQISARYNAREAEDKAKQEAERKARRKAAA